MRLIALLILMACASGNGGTLADRNTGGFPITVIDAWSNSFSVPRRYQHVVPDMPTWPLRYFMSGDLICIPDINVWTIAHIGDRPACRWYSPRGP